MIFKLNKETSWYIWLIFLDLGKSYEAWRPVICVKWDIHVTNLENSLREDESIEELDNESILHNAPETTSGQIKIPRVFENE